MRMLEKATCRTWENRWRDAVDDRRGDYERTCADAAAKVAERPTRDDTNDNEGNKSGL